MKIETESMSFQQLVESATKLYMQYGKFGKGMISDDAEQAITTKMEELGTYSLGQMQSVNTILQALTPGKEAEAHYLASSLYALVVESLPTGAIRHT